MKLYSERARENGTVTLFFKVSEKKSIGDALYLRRYTGILQFLSQFELINHIWLQPLLFCFVFVLQNKNESADISCSTIFDGDRRALCDVTAPIYTLRPGLGCA